MTTLTPKKLVPFVLLGLGACTPLRMAAPSDLGQDVEVLETSGRSSARGSLVDESFKLGPYAVSSVDRDWTTSQSFSSGNLSHENLRAGYTYKFGGGDSPAYEGLCAYRQNKGEADLGSLSITSRHGVLTCRCQAPSGEFINARVQGDGGKAVGNVSFGDETLVITSVHDAQGGARVSDAIGYRIEGDSGLAAAEAVAPGRVWLRRDLRKDERAAFSCLFSGMMLFDPPDNH